MARRDDGHGHISVVKFGDEKFDARVESHCLSANVAFFFLLDQPIDRPSSPGRSVGKLSRDFMEIYPFQRIVVLWLDGDPMFSQCRLPGQKMPFHSVGQGPVKIEQDSFKTRRH